MVAGARAQRPVGSTAWVAAEKENIAQLVNQEMEEIEYPVRHELEWLNEHMAEVFSSNQFNVTEIFKTPGKMRGKTPRTARKRNVEQARVPLSDIFSSANQPPRASPFNQAIAKLAVNKDAEKSSQPQYPDLRQNMNSFPKYNTDSGYHGMADEDEMVLPGMQQDSQPSTQPIDEEPTLIAHDAPSPVDRRTTEGSFHSAQENVLARGETLEPMNIGTSTPKKKVEVQVPEMSRESTPVQSSVRSPEKKAAPSVHESQPAEKESNDDMELDNQFDDIGSPSDGSTPERPLMRKSSLTFASLPAREPLMTKKSMGGARISRTSHVDLAKMNTAGRPSYFGRQTGPARNTQAVPEQRDEKLQEDKMDIDEEKELHPEDLEVDTQASKLHTKSSTQRLHEKISMLGKLQPSRPTKSIPAVSALAGSQVAYPDLSNTKQEPSTQRSGVTPAPEPADAEDDEWIKPLASSHKTKIPKSNTADVMENVAGHETVGNMEKAESRTAQKTADSPEKSSPMAVQSKHGKTASTSVFSSPQRYDFKNGLHQKSASASNLDAESTTPSTSPRRHDGPLSASKSKLQSIMKTAKGLFTSSAGVSAAAKMETLSPTASRTRPGTQHGAVEKDHSRPASPSPPRYEGRRTRSSTEREEKRKQKELEDRQRVEEETEKAREQERQKVAQHKASLERAERERREASEPEPVKSSPKKAPQLQKQAVREPEPSASHAQQAPRPADRRPVRPTRETAPKPKPQPVSIRVGSALSRQIPLASASFASQIPEPSQTATTPAAASKQPGLSKKASNTSLYTTASTGSFKSSVSSQSQRKAQLAADRKREQEEREARRKEEQKREQERKRAAQQQQEEARRQEMRNRAEAERREREQSVADDPKKSAQKQAIEKRRLENTRKLERQGSQQPTAASELNSILQQEKGASQASQRSDLGTNRPASRLGSAQPFGRSINQPAPNPAKPPKRALEEEAHSRATAPKPSMAYQTESKRRKTEDEHNPLPPVRPTMAPPIRQSSIRKEASKSQIFPHGYPTAPPPAAHHQASLYKNAPAAAHAQHAGPSRPGHPLDMSKYTSGKIPFADAPNQGSSSQKTPGHGVQKAPARPSPKYPSGESIHLPEIATDSEEEDSDAEIMPVPKWAQPDELRALLIEQEGKEADMIFGPIAPFSLEETFKADKKIKKFRDRTSSANWAGPDGLTQEEVRKDLAERQRLRLNGGWTFAP
ncbi:hypothetical protein DTO164E3_6385 [Paecilomyces variotii]|nr:hypothetical protein DTO164E3_6385 [Paecilomyces variotii]KAJ9221385.1 hypothetical protein DTO169C6_6212 [Paecilomyces variotii]KAJ9288808.1 hypothetical protein DTO021C3_3608 [Paecilomyces variotii]KAJ9357363.1 hypothetical protein DTO027B9_3066 [Paecilomyces variotii]KAJ9407903.1 hypothetical protein DTO045G8_4370 [Paecilomyces variotii]